MVVNRQNASIQEAARYCCPCCACNALSIAPIRSWIRLIAFSGRSVALNPVILPIDEFADGAKAVVE